MRAVNSLLALLFVALVAPAFADEQADAQETIANFKRIPASQPYFNSAYGYAVFPTIGKGGVGIGGAYGKGLVYEQGRLLGESKMVQLSAGLQLGGQAYSQIVFFRNKDALNDFVNEGFEFSADASAVALTVGANAEAGTKGVSASANLDEKKGKAAVLYHRGMAVLTLAKGGLMYQAALAGQKYSFKAKQ